MTPEQVTLVKQSFELVAPIVDVAAELFYDRLFTIDPSLRPMFNGDMKAQGRKLMQTITVVVHGLDRIETLVPAVQALGRRHGKYGVMDEHYNTVASALIWTLEQGLGSAFTPDVRDAWVTAYTLLADTMKAAAAEANAPMLAIAA